MPKIKVKKSKNSPITCCDEPPRYPETFRLEDKETLNNVSVGDKITLTTQVEMTGEESRNYDGKKKETQTFQINSVEKSGSKESKNKSKLQRLGRGSGMG